MSYGPKRDRMERADMPRPPAWWRRLAALREPAKKLRDSRIWGFWERLSLAQQLHYRKRHEGKPRVCVAPVYPREPVCHAKRHRRNGRGRVKMRSY